MPAWMAAIMGQVVNNIQSRIASGISSSLISAAMAIIRAPFTIISGILRTTVAVISSVVRMLLSATGAIAHGLFKVGELLLGMGAAAIGGFLAAVKVSTSAMMELAKAAGQLRASTGMSYQQSASTLMRFGSVGIKPEDVNSMFGGQSPRLFALKAGLGMGLPGYTDPDFLAQYASRYAAIRDNPRFGMFGPSVVQNIAEGMGTNTPQMQFVANLGPARIREEQGFTANLQSKLGVGPEAIRKYAEEIPLLINRIGQFVEAVKMRFAQDLLPVVEGVLNGLIDFFSANADKIAGAIRSGVEWLYAEFPVLVLKGLLSLTHGVQAMVNAWANGAHLIVGFVRSIGQMFIAFAKGQPTFLDNIGSILLGFDYLSVAFKGLAVVGGALVGVLTAVYDAFAIFINNMLDTIKGVLTSLLTPAASLLSAVGLHQVQDLVDALNKFNPALPLANPLAPIQSALAIKTTDMYGQFQNYQNSAAPMNFGQNVVDFADNADKNIDTAQGAANGVLSKVESFLNQQQKNFGTPAERHAEFQRLIKAVEGTEKHAATIAAASNKTADNMMGFADRMRARIASNLIETESMLITGVTG